MADSESLDIATRRAAFIKARAVLKDLSQADDLDRARSEAPAFFAQRQEAALTDDEAALIRDSLDHTRKSKFAQPPEGYRDKLPELYALTEA